MTRIAGVPAARAGRELKIVYRFTGKASRLTGRKTEPHPCGAGRETRTPRCAEDPRSGAGSRRCVPATVHPRIEGSGDCG